VGHRSNCEKEDADHVGNRLGFRKGHWVLGLIGFTFPVLWLVGAILPARRLR
jgi:hypothetical protein